MQEYALSLPQPQKQFYLLAIISGSYGEKGENYEFRGEYLTDMIEEGIVEVDVSEYNSSEIGTYTIYVKLGTAVLSDWKCADLYEDGKIDVYDFIVMRENFVKNMK